MFVVERKRLMVVGVAAVLAMVGVGCSEDEPQGFTTDSRNGFLAACTQPLDDSRLTSAICQCVFDETQAQIAFDRFREIDEALQADPEAELADEVLEIVATCVIDETGL